MLCRRAKAKIPLSPRGLHGGAEPLGAKATCLASRQVFVHMHVVMAAKPKWTSNAQVQVAHGKPLSTEIAVQAQKAKALVFMSIADGRAGFYSATACF
jgi:hypothetical protein